MKKALRERLQARLDKALEPPRAITPKADNSDSIVGRYSVSDPPSAVNPAHSDSLPESSSLPIIERAKISSLSIKEWIDPQNVSLPISSSPQDETLNLMASLPSVDGYTKLWHQMTDHLYCQLTTAEQAVHIQLFRLSWGYGSPSCIIGLPKLSKRVGAAQGTIQKAVDGLIRKGLIRKLRIIQGKAKIQGVEYEVTPPPSMLKSGSLPDSGSLSVSSTNKVNTQKENTQTQDSLTAAVRVGSKFSIEECRKYAKHLQDTGQGINNPGGYATTIHRTGEADKLIESFLKGGTNPQPVRCDDCREMGGMVYVDWNDPRKGVKRCAHENLAREGN